MRTFILTAFCLLAFSRAAADDSQTRAPAGNAAQGSPSQADQATNAAALMQSTGGSLLRASIAAQQDNAQAQLADVSFFSVPAPEPRVLKKHDLVTIIVREASEFSSDGQTDLKKTADLDAKIEQFVRLNIQNMELENSIGGDIPQVKMSSARNFNGEATVDRIDTFITRVTAEVIDVKPNGNLVIQARSRIKTDEEEQLLVLSGVCRAEDVQPDNTILSSQIFDKDLVKQHKGAVRDTTKRGWVPKLLDALNPF